MLVSLWLLMTIHLLRSMIITTHTRLFSSFFSIYIVLISSLLCFPRPVYVLLPELLSVISYWFSKRESDGADDSYALMAYCEIMNGQILKICLFVLCLASLQTKTKFKGEKKKQKQKQKQTQNKRTSPIQVEGTTQTITHLVEKACLLKFVKLWKLLLVSLRVLMTIHLLRNCFQLFEYYISYFLIVLPLPSLCVLVRIDISK